MQVTRTFEKYTLLLLSGHVTKYSEKQLCITTREYFFHPLTLVYSILQDQILGNFE